MMRLVDLLPDACLLARHARTFTAWLSGFLLLVLLPLPAVAVQYVMTMTNATYPAVTPFGTDTLLEDDGFYPISGGDANKGVDIGFDFPFYCNNYSRIFVNPNGFITLGSKASGQYDDTDSYAFPLDATEYSNPEFYGIPMIAPLWADALTEYATDTGSIEANGKVWLQVDTTSTPKKVVVTWEDVFHWYGWCDFCAPPGLYADPNTTGNNMQLILYEDGRIQFNYGAMGWSGVNTFYGTEGTVGIYSGSTSGSCQDQATPSGEFFPHDTDVAGKQLTYLLDTDGDNIADDGDASGVAGDHFCTSLLYPPSEPYKPPVTASCDDNCPALPNPFQDDNEGDGIGDACDTDDDNDTNPDTSDNCPLVANQNQTNSDADSYGNACDNCPVDTNQNQADNDSDNIGDVCDPDDDNDGLPDTVDNCPLVTNTNQNDYDGDGLGDLCDLDADDDGLLNMEENHSNWLDADSDNDNYTDFEEYWHNGVAGYQSFINRDTNPYSPDTDYDGLLDGDEVHLYGTDPLDPLDPVGGNLDADGDGILDADDPLPYDFNYQDGDINNSMSVDAGDIVVATRIVLGTLTPDTVHYQHFDVYPQGAPDGIINLSDLLLVIQMAQN
jgi:hypothetical protein